jgi:hypothetical protein
MRITFERVIEIGPIRLGSLGRLRRQPPLV